MLSAGRSAGPAGATNNNPAGNPSSPAIAYESDCTSSLEANQVAPFITSTDIDTTADTLAPTGKTFGVAGGVTQKRLIGPVLAGINGSSAYSGTIGFAVSETFGSTDTTGMRNR